MHICTSCVYYLSRLINGDEDREVRVCMLDKYVFKIRDKVPSCNFYNPEEKPVAVPNEEEAPK